MPPDNPIIDTAAMQTSGAADGKFTHPLHGLYIVATPIGNLRDITLRALDILRAADIILAEDTRQTQKLLNAYNIRAKLVPYHDHNAAKQIKFAMDALSKGQTVAQVSDAGTPLISDPGYKLVREAIAANIPVFPIPGASAVLTALTVAGLPTDKFMFAGFLPSKSQARQKALKAYISISATLVFFESANRILDSLSDIKSILGDRPCALARELTKRYEETRRGPLSEIMKSVEANPPRGEIVILVGTSQTEMLWTEPEIDAALMAHINDMGVKRASNLVAELSGWHKRNVYQRALELNK